MKTIKFLLRNNLLAKKYLVIKNLILDKLNIIISLTQQSNQKSQEIQDNANKKFQETQDNANKKFQEIQDNANKKFQEIQEAINTILENQVFLLKSSVDTVQAVHKSIATSESALRDLSTSIGRIDQSVGGSYSPVEQASQKLGLPLTGILDLNQNQKVLNAANNHLLHKVISDASYFQALEIELLFYLYSFLPYPLVIDVGANRGDISVRLLQTGYKVYALEPYPPVYEKLKQRLANHPHFYALPYALGAVNETRELYLAAEVTANNSYDDPTFYNSFLPHSLAEGLVFQDSISVIVKSLSSLHQTGEIPCEAGIVRIDTEGFDLEVIKGMGDYRYPVVMAKFWDLCFSFGKSGAMNYLKDMVPAMRKKNYLWHIVVYRIWGRQGVSYYCNSSYSLENSWGDVFFFQDQGVFLEAFKWCNATMPATYFTD